MPSTRSCRQGGWWRALTGGLLALTALAPPRPAWPQPLAITVESGVQLALEHHEDLQVARARVDAAHLGVRAARADLLPQVTAAVGYTRNWVLPSIVFNDQALKLGSDNSASGSLTLRQSLYAGGRNGAALGAARHRLEAGGEQRRAVEQETRARVESAVYDYLLAGEMVRVSQLRLDLARTSLSQAQALRRVGRAPEYDVIRANVLVASARTDSIAAANDLNLAGVYLRDAIGLDLERAIEVVARFRATTALPVHDAGALVRLALTRRPDWLELRAQLAAAQSQVGVARAGSRPSLSLSASGQMQFQNDKLDVLTHGREWRRSWSTGIALQVPVFDGWRTGAQVGQARVEVKALEVRLQQLERDLELQVRAAQLELGEAGERLEVQRGVVDEAGRGLAIAQARYGTGAGTHLEVLDAQVTVVQARSAYARAQRDRAVALVAVERAVGVLGHLAAPNEGAAPSGG